MGRVLIQLDNRGRITIPVEFRQKWNIDFGDYIILDLEKKIIDRANIITDEELKSPEVIESILKLGQKAEKDFYEGKTKLLGDYIAERGMDSEI
ncbi:MAG: AbrB/MazE/SpoVT family DNA-binding domain-containing protein [Desulfotomaculum sp.]|nr:AbrB/MazE/SpoVT family DNA-binding domain-containing protein [Desulfotomaculum sp.]MCL0080838.1 AbrB/MazE/SpoVT family DNA-binding domain-containing protein [Peptococcaceae bacterium]